MAGGAIPTVAPQLAGGYLTGRALIFPLSLVISLFFLWGFSYGLLDVLNKHFQDTLHVGTAEVMVTVSVLDADAVEPGQWALAQLFLEDPVTVVWGAADRILPVPDGVELRRVEAGHMPHMEAAGEVLEAIRSCL